MAFLVGLVGLAVLALFSVPLGQRFSADWPVFSQWFALIPITVLVVYSIAKANYRYVQQLQDERNEARQRIVEVIIEKEKQIDGLQETMKRAEQTKPCLLLVDVIAEPINLVNASIQQPLGKIFHVTAMFKNDPQLPSPTGEAHSVLAEITYYDENNNRICGPIEGRWADTDQPSTRGPFSSKSDLKRVPFGIGSTRPLDLAMKHPEDLVCYAFNNNNYDYIPLGFRHPDHLLDGGTFYVHVRLRDVYVDEEWWFTLVNNGQNGDMEITPLVRDKEVSQSGSGSVCV